MHHDTIHLNEKNYKCEISGKVFESRVTAFGKPGHLKRGRKLFISKKRKVLLAVEKSLHVVIPIQYLAISRNSVIDGWFVAYRPVCIYL